jgi:hypothetical protein
MKMVKRYSFVVSEDDGCDLLRNDKKGEWVKHSDYQTLSSLLAERERELKNAREELYLRKDTDPKMVKRITGLDYIEKLEQELERERAALRLACKYIFEIDFPDVEDIQKYKDIDTWVDYFYRKALSLTTEKEGE